MNNNDRVEIGLQASVEGFANEHITAGILMKRYKNVSLVDLPLSPYDIIIVFKRGKGEDIIRAQVKTAKKTVKFTGGTRGGADRFYKSDVKVYRQSTKTADVVIGIEPDKNENKFNLYFIPTILIEALNQDSISINKIVELKDNYEILEKCKDKSYVEKFCRKYSILKT